MAFDGEMTLDATASNFQIQGISAYDINKWGNGTGDGIASSVGAPASLTINELHHGEHYYFIIEGQAGITTGMYDIVIYCVSDAPTKVCQFPLYP